MHLSKRYDKYCPIPTVCKNRSLQWNHSLQWMQVNCTWFKNIFLFTIFRLSCIWCTVTIHYCLCDIREIINQPKCVMIFVIDNSMLYMEKLWSILAHKNISVLDFRQQIVSSTKTHHFGHFNLLFEWASWPSLPVRGEGLNLVH